MKTSVLTLLMGISSLVLSCQNSDIKQKIENDEVIQVASEDKQMNNAIEQSISSFEEFKKVFKQQNEGDESFAIKMRFDTPDGGGEHIWIGDIFLKDEAFYGTVNNTPYNTKEVKLGDSIKIDLDRLSDWMYLSKGVLKGGNTLRVMRDQLSEAKKKDFDEFVGFIIEQHN